MLQSPTPSALTCTCPSGGPRSGLPSPSVWQQAWATTVWGTYGAPPAGTALCLNWGGATFQSPVPQTQYLTMLPWLSPLAASPVTVIWALSVLDRIDSPLRFVRQATALLADDGLLSCTFAIWDADGEDCALGHELRRRIFNRYSWEGLVKDVRPFGLRVYGGVDWGYHGAACGDHSLGTVVWRKTGRQERIDG